MGLKDKLSRLTTPIAPRPAEPPAPPPGAGRSVAQDHPAPRVVTAFGPLHLRERRFSPPHRHGQAELRRALGATARELCALAQDPGFEGVPLDRMLLLDTETTGLSGGTGTLPFLIGLGWFEGEELRLAQLVLDRPGGEAPLLSFLEAKLAAASLLVTYNGKSFDWPLLRTRFVMNRRSPPKPPPHLDLLHCARRIFKGRIQGARLIEMERVVLGHAREDDLPGAEVPERYFRYLRGGGWELLRPVLEHNEQDLLLLAALLGELSHRIGAPEASSDPRDHLAFAQVLGRAGDAERSSLFARAATAAADPAIRARAHLHLFEVRRRQRDPHGAAEALLKALTDAQGALARRIHLELAKLYEHRLRDLTLALRHAEQAHGAEPQALSTARQLRLRRRLGARGDEMPLLQLTDGDRAVGYRT